METSSPRATRPNREAWAGSRMPCPARASIAGATSGFWAMGAALYRQGRREQPVPELPDLLHVVGKLRERLVGKHVVAEHVKEPVVLRFAVRGNLSLLLGRALQDVFRKSHFLVFRF